MQNAECRILTKEHSRQNTKFCTLHSALCTILTCLALTGCSADRSTHWTIDEGGIIRGDRAEKRLALVFTGGSYGEGTEPILDALHAAGIKASFFVTGEYLAAPEHAPLLRRMIAEGHYLGPHSHAHPLYCSWENRKQSLVAEADFKEDLRTNLAELAKFSAPRVREGVYFIPPYEWYNAEQAKWARDMGITLFNFTPGIGSNRDWMPESEPHFTPSRRIHDDILAFEQRDRSGLNGAIVLMHLGSQRADKMHALLPELLAELQRRGYACLRIDELLKP